jgi:hypothetical protein
MIVDGLYMMFIPPVKNGETGIVFCWPTVLGEDLKDSI